MLRVNSLSGFGRIIPAVAGGAMPVLRAVGGLGQSAGAPFVQIPAGVLDDDIGVMFLETADEAVTVTGWTEAGNSPIANTGNTRLTVFWKRLTAAEAETFPTVSDSGDHTMGRIIAVSGCPTSGDPFNVTASGGTGSGTAVSIVGATTSVANCFVFVAVANDVDVASDTNHDSWTNGDLTSLTERIDNNRTPGNGGGLGVATGEKATAGAYGTTSVTLSNSGNFATWTGALKGA